MRRLYLIDYLGNHCGMDYYLEAFREVLTGMPGFKVEIISNFSDEDSKEAFFVNQYKGGKLQKGLSLLRNLRRLRKLVSDHPEDIFVYLSYGNMIDIPFLKIIAKAPNHVIDIHEGIAQNIDTNKWVYGKLKAIYSRSISAVISHSSRTDNFLREFGFTGKRFNVPHFKYVFPKNFNMDLVAPDLRESVEPSRINLLFFGNLNKSKGVDLLLDAFNKLDGNIAGKLNLIVAGKDFDGSVWEVSPLQDRHVHIHARHIRDDELRFLYDKVDYLCLPYRKTSQSGILEMAFYFRTPIIASKLPYFEHTLSQFPSFGILAGNTPEEYASVLSEIAEKESKGYFKDDEYAAYENRAEIKVFKKEFGEWSSQLK